MLAHLVAETGTRPLVAAVRLARLDTFIVAATLPPCFTAWRRRLAVITHGVPVTAELPNSCEFCATAPR